MNKNFFFAAWLIIAAGCNNETSDNNTKTDSTKADTSLNKKAVMSNLKEEKITYTGDGVSMNGYVVYDSMQQGKRPAVLVVHEWWGQTDYPRMRARKLAELGYIAMAVDIYGNGKLADNPTDAQKLSSAFYANWKMTKARFDAALNKLKTFPQVDQNNIAAIGYCFGGGVVLNMAKMGDDLKGVVSFHGSLEGVPADKNLLKAKILVCHGADDKFVSQANVSAFKKQMDSIHADCTIKQYPNSTHAFTNPEATELGKKFNLPIAYNKEADEASWNDMRDFFARIFK